MARETTKVALKKPFEGKGGMRVTEITVQEPTAKDFFTLGAPQTWVKAPGGMALVDNDASIRAYVERAIVDPDPLLAISQMSLLDAIAVKDAVLDFFRDATATTST